MCKAESNPAGSASDDGHGWLRCLLTSSLHEGSKPHPGAVEKSTDFIVPINAIYFRQLSKLIA